MHMNGPLTIQITPTPLAGTNSMSRAYTTLEVSHTHFSQIDLQALETFRTSAFFLSIYIVPSSCLREGILWGMEMILALLSNCNEIINKTVIAVVCYDIMYIITSYTWAAAEATPTIYMLSPPLHRPDWKSVNSNATNPYTYPYPNAIHSMQF